MVSLLVQATCLPMAHGHPLTTSFKGVGLFHHVSLPSSTLKVYQAASPYFLYTGRSAVGSGVDYW